MALGGALGLAWSPVTPGTPRHFAWQAWHKLTSTVVLRGRRGTHGTVWRAWTGLVARDARDAAALCVAGVAQTHIHRRFAWQAWHSWHWVARLDWLGRPRRPGRRGMTPGTPRHFAWQAWHKLTSTVVLRGRRGTTSHPLSFCVAGVALMALGGALGLAWSPVTPRHFAWQAWHNLTSTFVSRGRRGTNSHLPSFQVADGTGQVKLVICMQRCGPCSWSRGRAQLRFSNAVQRRHDRFCFLHADFHHVFLVVLFWSN